MQTERRLWLPKSRDMMLSWAVMGYAVWKCQWFPATEVLVQTQKEDKAVDLVTGREKMGYVRTLYEMQTDFLKVLNPTSKPPSEMAGDLFSWANESSIRGIPAGAHQFRQWHPSLAIFDEAAFVDEWADSYRSAQPVCSQIIVLSSAYPSAFFDLVEDAFEFGSKEGETPPFGCDFAREKSGTAVARTYYFADPAKRGPEWEATKRKEYGSDQLFEQEQKINPSAYAGQRVFPEFERRFTVIEPYPIPKDVTIYCGIDPHPRVPHAFLWMFCDRYGNHVYHREYWPSKVYGLRGNLPEDDDLYQIDDYVATLQFLEGPEPNLAAPNGFTDNAGCQQKVYRRIMDPAGKAWEAQRTAGKADVGETFWDRYANLGIDCEAARKDFQAGRDRVGTLLRPRKYLGPDGERQQSQILIFNTCKELIFQLENNRYPSLTPTQVGKKDPSEKPIEARRHMADLLRYIEMADPQWIDPDHRLPHREPIYADIPGFG
jgi:hypothetical protein